MVVFEHVENLKREFTDKYVVVDVEQPELRRFEGMTGVVRTVNMSGRALVEFDAYNNIGWYDIAVDFLKFIDEPLEKEEAAAAPAKEKKPAAKAAPVKEEAPAAKAAPAKEEAPAAAPATDGAMSVDDILAAARGGGGSDAPAAPAESTPEPAAEVPAEAAAPAAPAEKVDPSSMSVDDILAAARGGDGGAAPAAPAESTPEPAAEVEAPVEEAPAEEVVEEPAAPAGSVDKDSMTTDEILAYCRNVDG